MADAVLDHPSISRLHAAVCYEGLTGAWRVVDLGSAHGTFVDGRAVDKVRASAGGRSLLWAAYPVAGNDARAEARRWCILFLTKIMHYRRYISPELFTRYAHLGSGWGSNEGGCSVFNKLSAFKRLLAVSSQVLCSDLRRTRLRS